MHVISIRRLREFWERHPQAEEPLRAWYKVASKANWNHIEEVRADYPTADFINPETVFNIGGNDFRLEVVIVYRARKVYVKWVGTHAEYDRRHRRR